MDPPILLTGLGCDKAATEGAGGGRAMGVPGLPEDKPHNFLATPLFSLGKALLLGNV